MTTLLQDLRYGARLLARSPGFTAVAVLTLALGIGANTAIFSVVNGLLLKPLPFGDPARLVTIWERQPHDDRTPVALPNFLDWRAQARSFAALSAFRGEGMTLAAAGADPQRIMAGQATADFFATIGVRPWLGRGFLAAEDRFGHARAAVLGYGFWRRRFGADPDVLGRSIVLGGEPFTVVGVLPHDFRLPWLGTADLWVPLAAAGEGLMERGNHSSLLAVARLAPGVTPERARAEMEGIAARLAKQYPETNTRSGIGLATLGEELTGEARPALLVLLAAVALVLAVACANVANLMLARAAARRRETAIRSALGAGRGRLTRQLLTESVLLTTLGGAAGLLFAVWGVDLLRAQTDEPTVAAQIALDGRVLAFTAALALATGLLLGLAPALAASRRDTGTELRQTGGGAGRGRAGRINLLVASEVAFALLLATVAGLMIASFARLIRVDPGFDPRGVVAVEIAPAGPGYAEPARRRELYRQALERVAALPGVEAAGLVHPLPLSNTTSAGSIEVEGWPAPGPGESSPSFRYQIVSPGYFRALGIPLRSGRNFGEQDLSGPGETALVDEDLARKLWPDEQAVGRRFRRSGGPWMTVVGVVGSIRPDQLDAPPEPQFYLPYARHAGGTLHLVARAAGEPAALLGTVRGELRALDRSLPLDRANTLAELVHDSTEDRRLPTLLLGLFAAVTLALAALGVYGVTSYAVARRTGEIGIRGALGADRLDIVRLVLSQGMRSALLGIAAGLAGSLALTRFLAGLLYGVSPTDLSVFTAVALLLGATATLASWLPARRAARLEPSLALRSE